jgi:arginyl-tRNA synthetase
MRKYNKPIDSSIDVINLNSEEEQRVIELLADFPESISDAARNNDPYFVAIHLLKLAGAFNKFYQRKTEDNQVDKIISDDEDLSKARMALVKSVQIVIKEGLRLLGIQAPDEM